MRNVIVLLGTLALVACSKDKVADKVGGTTTTGASADGGVTVEEVRMVLLERRPSAKDAINSVIITNEAGMITLRGRVEDEATHADMVNTVRGIPNVKGVNDQLQIAPKQQMGDQGKMGGDQAPMQHPGATQSTRTTAIRAGMMKDRPTDATVINALLISDDGTMIYLSGVVPDEPTHQALVESAEKYAAGKKVQDELKVKGN
jgi:osmotically-inducible protein OsmY